MVAGFGGTATAADVTDMPPELGAVAGLRYGGQHLWGALVEEALLVGQRRITRHDLDLLAEIAPIEGVALTLDLRITPSYRFAYPESRTMVIEPFDGTGSYLSGELVADTPEIRAGGFGGLWIGVAAAPFSESYALGHRATTRLDVALRTPSAKRNLWTAKDGQRGPTPGGSALRLAGAFSTDRGTGNPWLRAEWLRESSVTVDVVDEQGTLWASELELRPASTLLAETGIEIVAYRRPAANGEPADRVATDVWFGVGYRSWEDVASGVYLPSVLEGPRSIPVTTGDTMLGRAGLAVDVHATEHFRSRLGLTFDYAVPYRLEHVYNVTTSVNTFQLGVTLDLRGVGALDLER